METAANTADQPLMIRRFLKAVFSSLVVGGIASASTAADIRVVQSDYQLLGTSITPLMYIVGRIDRGDAERVRQILASLPEGSESLLLVALDSPGGNLSEGLEIARLFQSANLHVVIDILNENGRAADCASACALIYLGGDYRFLAEGSRLGVHQFSYAIDDITKRAETTREVQFTSAEITDLLSGAYVDPAFFSLMGRTGPEEVNWVDPSLLEQLNVLNRDVPFQTSEFALKNGALKHVMTREGLFGRNRVTTQCDNGRVQFTSEIGISNPMTPEGRVDQPGVIAKALHFKVLVDRYRAKADLTAEQSYRDQFIYTSFTMAPERLATLIRASSLDLRLDATNGSFLGTTFQIRDGKLRDMVANCVDIVPSDPATLGGSPDLEEPLSPVYIAATMNVANGTGSTSSALPAPSLEELAVDMYDRYLLTWSQPNLTAMKYMSSTYADNVNFYGKEKSKPQLIEEKHKFAERWPDRKYTARHNAIEVNCSNDICMVAAIVDWNAYSPTRGKTATGIALYQLGFDMQTGLIFFENGESQKK